jgi:hypothetical protein
MTPLSDLYRQLHRRHNAKAGRLIVSRAAAGSIVAFGLPNFEDPGTDVEIPRTFWTKQITVDFSGSRAFTQTGRRGTQATIEYRNISIAEEGIDIAFPELAPKRAASPVRSTSRAAVSRMAIKLADPALTMPEVRKAVEAQIGPIVREIWRDAWAQVPSDRKRRRGVRNRPANTPPK